MTRSSVREVTMAIGAHHLAEEETLYEALRGVAEMHVGQAKVFHQVLDDLTHTIECGGQLDEPLRYQMLLLKQLLVNHFQMEEALLLELFAEEFPRQENVDLGRLYRLRYQKYLTLIDSRNRQNRTGNSRPVPSLVPLD